MQYGYVRISTPQQNIDRQIRNIKAQYPDALIVQEIYTGTKLEGRREMEKLLRTVKSGDTIIFDSVSRMSRNAEEGFALYEKLYYAGVNLIFLKEPHINSDVYKRSIEHSLKLTGTNVDHIIKGINQYLMVLAKEQIQIAFGQSEKEVLDLRQRTKEGIETARLNGKQIGQKKGKKIKTKKSITAKEQIKKYNKSFNGNLTNEETWKLIGISHGTFYKYKNEIYEELS